MKLARFISELIGLAAILVWCICAAVVAAWHKVVASRYVRELAVLAALCGALGIGFAVAF